MKVKVYAVYGELCDRDLLLSTCRYALFAKSPSASQVQQLAMASWGALERAPAEVVEQRSARAQQRELGAERAEERRVRERALVARVHAAARGARLELELDQRDDREVAKPEQEL